MIGQQIDRYTIQEMIGQGGMATVYRAYDSRFERDVAVKFLYQPPDAHDMLTAERFEQEAKIIAGLEHHAIVPVYDYGEHDGLPYLVMRLMDGGTLKDRLIAGDLTLADISTILSRICSALDKAHQQYVVHRDIKPGNILFDEEGMAYLADFGIARLTDRTQTMSLIGSPRYMAPEQARGEKLTHHTDIYQMGVVLFHMLTGQVPFNADTTESILYQHVYEPVPAVTALAPDLPESCNGVMNQALAKQLVDRFASAGALARAFQVAIGYTPGPYRTTEAPTRISPTPPAPHSIIPTDDPTYTIPPENPVADPIPNPQPLDPSPTTYNPPPVAEDPWPEPEPDPPARTRWGWIIALSAVAIALFACGAGLFVIANPELIFPEAENPVVTVPTRPGLEQTPIDDGATAEPEETDSPGLAPTATIDDEPTDSGEVVLLLEQNDLVVQGGGEGVLAYAANRNPDSGNGFDIFIVNPDGTEKQLTTHDDADFRPVFSPDGRRIAYHSLRGTWEIFVVDVEGRSAINITNDPADDSFPVWSPDGNQIAFHSNRENRQFDIFITNADGTNVRPLFITPETNEFGPSWSPDGTRIVFHRQMPDNTRQIFVVNADGTNEVQLTTADGRSEYPVWSPDGSQLTFFSNRTGTSQIYTMNADGSGVTQLTTSDQGAFYPSWSANGAWVVYHTIESDTNREIYMVRPDGSDRIRLTDTDTQERMPAWK